MEGFSTRKKFGKHCVRFSICLYDTLKTQLVNYKKCFKL